MTYYVGILDGRGDVWGMRIPDFPGVHGGGPTPEAAIDDVISALREVRATMIAEGAEAPRARPLMQVLADEVTEAREVAVIIPLE